MRQFAVIGLGRFGASVATTLTKKGYQVLAIDSSEHMTQNISDEVTQAVCLDAHIDPDQLSEAPGQQTRPDHQQQGQ